MQEGSAQYYGTQSAAAIGLADQKTEFRRRRIGAAPISRAFRQRRNRRRRARAHLAAEWRQPGQIRVILESKTDSMKEIRDGYATLKGSTIAAFLTFPEQLRAERDRVHARGGSRNSLRFVPTNAAPPASGNSALISGIAFVRGTVKPVIKELTRAQLNLGANSATFPADQKDFGYKAGGERAGGGFDRGLHVHRCGWRWRPIWRGTRLRSPIWITTSS